MLQGKTMRDALGLNQALHAPILSTILGVVIIIIIIINNLYEKGLQNIHYNYRYKYIWIGKQ